MKRLFALFVLVMFAVGVVSAAPGANCIPAPVNITLISGGFSEGNGWEGFDGNIATRFQGGGSLKLNITWAENYTVTGYDVYTHGVDAPVRFTPLSDINNTSYQCVVIANSWCTKTWPVTSPPISTKYYVSSSLWSQIGEYCIHGNLTNPVDRPLSANFTQSPNPSTPGQQVTFNDTSTGSPTTWNWTFGDIGGSNTSTLQNPTHTYAALGTYSVSLNVTNATGSVSIVSHNHTVANATSFVQQDIWMLGAYTLRVHVQDTNGAVIPTAYMVDSGTGTTYSTLNGTIFATYPFQAVVGVVSSTGYNSKQFSTFVDEDKDVTVVLSVAVPNQTTVPNTNTIWSPFSVAIQVLDANLNPIVSDPVSITAFNSSLPGGLSGALSYFEKTYGVNHDTASSMFNASTEYAGTTDDNGYISTQVVSIIQYRVVTKDTAGNDVVTLIWPQGTYYQIKTGTAVVPGLAMIGAAQNNIYKNSTFNTSFWEPNASFACMGVNVYDSTGQTTIVQAWWRLVDNNSVWWTNTSIAGYGPVNSTKCVPHVPYQSWKWGGITG